MPISRKLDYVILNMIESSQKTIRAAPMNLGGIPGSGGGAGTPPGGFIGWLPQTRVAYDLSELATPSTSGGGSLLDNLNHIRYRLAIVEASGIAGTVTVVDDTIPATYLLTDTIHFSGNVVVTNLGSGDIKVTVSGGGGSALTVQEADGSPVITNTDKIIFSGMTVVDQGGGDAYVYPQASYHDSRYLKLDASNRPITGPLSIITSLGDPTTAAIYVVNNQENRNAGYFKSTGNSYAVEITQGTVNSDVSAPALYLLRESTGSGNFTYPLIEGKGYDSGTGVATGDWLTFTQQGSEKFRVTFSGSTNIPTGQTYKINNVPHDHTATYAPIAKGVTNGDSHDHFGGDGGTIAHTSLSSIGTNTHAQIDVFINEGWTAGTGTWSYSSADAPTFIISINADVTAIMGVGDRIKITQSGTKYFIITAVGTFGAGVTLVTVYGGTDYTLANSGISTQYYSHQKSPFGFPMSPVKWTTEVTNTSDCSKTTPTATTWYGGTGLSPTGISIDLPIGAWRVWYKAAVNDNYTVAATAAIGLRCTLSTANNTESDAQLTTSATTTSPITVAGIFRFLASTEKVIAVTTKTTYYLNILAGAVTAGDAILLLGATVTTIIRATCAYL